MRRCFVEGPQIISWSDCSLQQIVSYMRVLLEPACGIQWETRRKELSDYVAANSDMDPDTTVHHKLCTRKKRKAFNAVFKDAMFLYGIASAAFIVYSIREMLCWQSYQCISWWIFTIVYQRDLLSRVFSCAYRQRKMLLTIERMIQSGSNAGKVLRKKR